ncbi:recombinase family protein [Serratia fonticola]|uniref:recombinase family protein n=1 Tax=Serratia fonticola TaxID=47917 RepID=UPI00093AC917|nr:recombinase family protein [Serratia fonticola]OKP15860.1 resolvase [Serratia fonticola]
MQMGYARVSTDDQHLDLQRDALNQAGCVRLFEDTASGIKAERRGLAKLLTVLLGENHLMWVENCR